MEAFVWDQRFVTGLEKVDAQHRHLVDIVNLVGDILMARHSSEDDLQAIFTQLAEYARFHFGEEERLMDEVGIAAPHSKRHREHHAQFIEQVVQMWRGRATMSNPAEVLHGFLASWLSFHILDEDQSMARQIAAIRAGMPADQAFAAEHRAEDNNVSALLSALHKLYHLMALQNQELANANLGLEQKVAERTRELTAANARLATEQKELATLLVKMEEAQNQILQSEKMAAIGQLAAGVAHEINNPIGFVNSNLGTLKNYVERLLGLVDSYDQCVVKNAVQSPQLAAAKQEADLDFLREDVAALLGESREGLDRVKKIVQDLKDFSHIDQAELQDAEINAGLESTLNVVWNELKYKADIVKEYGELPPVRCIAGQMNQVFMNLLINAAQAIDQHGTITIRTGKENGEVWIEVVDSGRGMPAEVKKRVFEPFFTTKPVGKGTGLGLSLSYDIVVKKHGGRFEVESEPGKGSTFRVWLPVGGPQA
ncbi:MAG: ATP-binding protein [Rhodocyclaceae bacterium]|nr:ATP-binding protein [Rhodocyclaceae bacterium]